MKKVISLILLFAALYSNATTYYISPSGNDISGTGIIGNPWQTLFKACQTVTTSGDIIHVNAGTYTETAQCQLAVGVSIEGDGITSILRSTSTALYTPIILMASTQGTNGNQHVSFLKMEGQMTTQWAISVQGRSNVSLHDLTVVDFFDRGIVITGAYNTPLSIYATGNTFYNNIVTNCGSNNGNGYGCLMIGGQDGLLIYNNTITQNSRPDGQNGWPIKYMDEGHLKNMKMYNNTFVKNPQSGLQLYVDWNFVMELFNLEGGNEIYNNDCIGGGIDLVFLTKGSSTYSVWVHDNTVRMLTPNPNAFQMGVTCENEVPAYAPGQPNTLQIADVIIEHNTFTNLSVGVQFTERPGTFMHDITIKNNLFRDHASTGQAGFFIDLGSNGGTITMSNINVYNNTMFTAPGFPMYVGISLPSFMTGGTINGINIKNNNMGGTTAGSVLSQQNTIPINNLNVSNNNFYSNNIDVDIRTPSTVTNYVNANNIHVVPTYGSNYTLLSGSPLIDAGTNVGIAYSGAAPDIGYAEFIVGGNVAPSANAGADRTIVLPKDSVQLHGSGSDVAPGTVIAYAWTRISGPNTPTLAGATTPNLTITGMIQGTYIYRLTVTDDSLVNNTGYDEVTITVNPIAGNAPPVANAGVDVTLNYPTNARIITGSATDADGTVTAYAWHKVSGAAYTSIDSTSAVFKPENMSVGVYLFELIATDNLTATGRDTMQLTISSHTGGAKAFAGIDKSVTTVTTTLYGAVSGATSSPTFNIFNEADKSANIILSNGGLTITSVPGTDRSAARGTISVTNGQKIVYQVVCQTIGNGIVGMGNSSASLGDFCDDANGWGYNPGSGGKTHNGVYEALGNAIGEGDGAIILLYIDLTNGATNAGTMRVVVNGTDLGIIYSNLGGTLYPMAGSFNDALSVFDFSFGQTIFSFDNGFSAGPSTSGSGASNIVSILWSKLSGPGGTIVTPNAAITNLTGLSVGDYSFEIVATDNLGATVRDTMLLTVSGGNNISPNVNAGADQSIALPTNSVTLNGSATDPDGTVVFYNWSKVSGPGSGTITTPSSPTTTVTSLVQGVYVFRLDATDNDGANGFDDVQITVNAAGDVTPPTVISSSPANAATGVNINIHPVITFSEPLNPGTVTNVTAYINGVAGTVSYAANAITITPTTPLIYSSIYTITITTGVQDVAGNALAANYTSTFTTAAAPPSGLKKRIVITGAKVVTIEYY